MNSSSRVERSAGRRRRSGCVGCGLLVLVLLLGVLVGAWLVVVRPYLHNIAQAQLDQALGEAEGQMLLFQLALPSGDQSIHVDEGPINNYLSLHDSGQLQDLHATISPDDVLLSFTAYGLACSITTLPIATAGMLQATDVQVQGVLWLVMSNSELTSALNSNFQSFGSQMHRPVRSITLHEHTMDIQLS